MRTFEEQTEGLYNSFKHGLKPSLWLLQGSEDDLIRILTNQRYPRKKIISKNGYIYYWFFQNKTIKKEFLDKSIHISLKNGDRDHLSMGILLGFPPEAVYHFSSICGGSSRIINPNNIGISYAGIVFASYKETIKSDFEWLLKEKPIPKGYGFKVYIGSTILNVDDTHFEDRLIKTTNSAFA